VGLVRARLVGRRAGQAAVLTGVVNEQVGFASGADEFFHVLIKKKKNKQGEIRNGFMKLQQY